MSFKDIISNGLSTNSNPLSVQTIFFTVIIALICSCITYFTYKRFYRGAAYSENFGILLVIMCLITTFIIATISSNYVLSLGMVGALSIVRFRSAIKDPLDIGFLFWSIASGITIGAGLFAFALITTIIIAAIYIAFTLFASGTKTFLLVLKYDNEADEKIREALKTVKNVLKSKSIYKGKTELTLQLKLKETRTKFVQTLSEMDGVDSAMLVEYTGDYI